MANTPVMEQSHPAAALRAALPIEALDTASYVIARGWGYEAIKAVMDIVGALVGLLIALPICTLIAILIKLDSPGAILFRQRRPGKDGKPFVLLKLRTMEQDAEEKLDEVVDIHNIEDPLIRLEHDPRVTRIGHLLRLASLDELPQLVNVLKGEMSLVGPRPISRPIYDRRNAWRLKVKPGITGLWQVAGRKNEDTDYMLSKDIEYLRRRSLSFDLLLLLRTVVAVLKADGAR